MKVTFIMPSMGRKNGNSKYVKTWIFEPLQIAVLSALTPKDVDREFFDDRNEPIDFNTRTDLVAISTETFNARRSYEIARRFRDRGVKVVMGGFHPTLIPEEAKQYVDAVVIGEAENVWEEVLDDVNNNQLKKEYKSSERPSLANRFPDRSIFEDKKYMDPKIKIALIETGRGCKLNCDFFSICKFYNHSYVPRPVEDIVAEIKQLKKQNRQIFLFVEDNFNTDVDHIKELFEAIVPLKITWLSQGNITMANDPELLSLMKRSGCMGFLVGLESIRDDSLRMMKKSINVKTDIDSALEKMTAAGLRIFATFIFGYDNDTSKDYARTFKFSEKHKIYMAAFNHALPFPGTDLYDRWKEEGKMLFDAWWLSGDYKYGQVAFKPKNFTPRQLEDLTYEYEKKFFGPASILRRSTTKVNFSSFFNLAAYFYVQANMAYEVRKRQGLSMGLGWDIQDGTGQGLAE